MLHSNEIIIVTNNNGKIREIEYVLKSLNFSISTLTQNGILLPHTVEIFSSYEENAKAKGDYVFEKINKQVISDDSGLEVDCLSGEPGIFSSRYSSSGSDIDNRKKMLNNVKNFPEEQRKAKFICVLYFRDENKSLFFKGEVEGLIIDQEKGQNGFGYDPIFYHQDSGKTFAELSFEEKIEISHRGNALRKLKNYLIKKNTEGGI